MCWEGYSPPFLSIHVSDVVRVLLVEFVDGDLTRELILEELQTSLHAQTNAAEKASELLAAVVEQMARVTESLVHGHHTEREGLPRNLPVR